MTPDDCSNIIFGLTKFETLSAGGDASLEVQHALGDAAVEYLAGGYPRCAVQVLKQMLSHWGPAGFVDALQLKFDDLRRSSGRRVRSRSRRSSRRAVNGSCSDLAGLYPLPGAGVIDDHIRG